MTQLICYLCHNQYHLHDVFVTIQSVAARSAHQLHDCAITDCTISDHPRQLSGTIFHMN